MKKQITEYYNNLASYYDKNRFDNSYGRFINFQEIRILKKYLSEKDISKNLDIACGTGRFLNYADYGIDISSKMVEIARKKFPEKNIILGDIENLPYKKSFFQNVLSFHLFMHLENNQLKDILDNVSNISQEDGLFIFDIPSRKRRKLTGYQTSSWHGGNQISVKEIKELIKEKWELISYQGVAFFPIHLLPKKIRKFFIPFDTLICNSIFREFSSHIIYVLKRK